MTGVAIHSYVNYLLDVVADALHVHVDSVQLQLPLSVVELRRLVPDAPIRLFGSGG